MPEISPFVDDQDCNLDNFYVFYCAITQSALTLCIICLLDKATKTQIKETHMENCNNGWQTAGDPVTKYECILRDNGQETSTMSRGTILPPRLNC